MVIGLYTLKTAYISLYWLTEGLQKSTKKYNKSIDNNLTLLYYISIKKKETEREQEIKNQKKELKIT